MKSLFLSLSLLLSFALSGFAQRSDPFTMQLQNLYSGESIDVYDLRSQKQEGTLYWNPEWAKGTVKLKNGGKVDAFPMRFDLMGQGLEIFLGSETKLLPGSMIEEFYLEGPLGGLHHFVNLSPYFGFQGFSDGFFEVMIEDDWTLLQKAEIEILKPNYVVALDAGNMNQSIIRKDVYYLFHDGELVRIPKQKKKAIRVLGDYVEDIEARVKAQKLNLKQEASLRKLVLALNEEGVDTSR